MAPLINNKNAHQIQGVNVDKTPPTDNQILRYDVVTESWVPELFTMYQYIPIPARIFQVPQEEAGYWDTDIQANGFPQMRMTYTNSEAHVVYAEVDLPEDCPAGNFTILMDWKTAGTAASTFVLDVYATRLEDGDTDDVAISTKVVSITDTNTGTGKMNHSAETSAFTITGTGKKLRFKFTRDYATDTLVEDVKLLGLVLKCIVTKV